MGSFDHVWTLMTRSVSTACINHTKWRGGEPGDKAKVNEHANSMQLAKVNEE